MLRNPTLTLMGGRCIWPPLAFWFWKPIILCPAVAWLLSWRHWFVLSVGNISLGIVPAGAGGTVHREIKLPSTKEGQRYLVPVPHCRPWNIPTLRERQIGKILSACWLLSHCSLGTNPEWKALTIVPPSAKNAEGWPALLAPYCPTSCRCMATSHIILLINGQSRDGLVEGRRMTKMFLTFPPCYRWINISTRTTDPRMLTLLRAEDQWQPSLCLLSFVPFFFLRECYC